VFCAHIGASLEAIGYYALQVGTDSVENLPGADQNYLKNYVAFPAIHLSFLGVHESYRRQGLGSYLLMDAFERIKGISEHCGFYALTLQSLDAESTAFYTSLNFAPYTNDPVTPKMLYPLGDIIALVNRGKQGG
jgi:GNAT superfamily N-acetyltransferase